MRVEPVRTTDQREAFLRLPWQVYAGDPNWVPPLLGDVRGMLDPARHPFHLHSKVELFLAVRDDRPVGRIAAIHNRRHLEVHDDGVGFFGFLEALDDPAVFEALLDAASGWLRERGLRTMRGPASFSTNEEVGLLVEGFDRPPVILMPYNPDYYAGHLTAHGCRQAKDLLAYFHGDNEPPERLRRAGKIVPERFGVRVRPIRMREFERELDRIHRIYNSAWEDNWGFVPMTEEEFRHMAHQLKPVVEPELALIAEDAAGRAVGFSLALPDYNPALKTANGRLFPLGLVKIWLRAKSIRRARVITLGLERDWRGKGVDALLYLETFVRGRESGIQEAEFSWILADNERMRRPLERFGARPYKRYRLYDRAL